MLFNTWFVPFFEMRFNFQISKYFSRENDTVQILDRLFFFSGKHLSPGLQKQHICFAARLGFIAFQGRQSQTNTFSSQRYTFASVELLFLELLRRAFWNMILQHQHLSEGRLHFKLLHLKKMLKRHDLATKMKWAAVQEKWKWTATKKLPLFRN